MIDRLANLRRLFAPRSVAVVGASTAAEKVGHQALLSLKRFSGAVYPIHPNASEILGYKAYASLSAIGEPVDMVLFAIPAAVTLAAVAEAVRCGCGGGVIVSGGFAETGGSGVEAQQQLRALCQRSGFRVLGPNTAGFFNNGIGLVASFAPGIDQIRPGRIGVIAQSGGINVITSFLVNRLGYGVSCGIGLGNAVDTDAADALEYLAEDEGTAAIALHLEGVRQGRKLYEMLRRVTPRKPVVVLAVGREDVGEFAQSHTGNLIGSYALKAAALQQAGAVLVSTTEELAAAAAVLSLQRLAPKRAPGIGVVVGQAGAGLVILDRLKSVGVAVPALAQDTVAQIGKLLPPMTFLKNPVDTGRPGPTFPDVLATVAADDQIDAIVAFAIDEPAAMRPVDMLPALRRRIACPIVFGTVGPESAITPIADSLRQHRIYVADSPERLAHAGTILAQDAANQWRVAQPPATSSAPPARHSAADYDEHTAKETLKAIGIDTPDGRVCRSHAEAHAALRSLKAPIVVKILSVEIAHKTEAGGVHVNISDENALQHALATIDAIPLKGARRYLLETMAPPGLEMIVGAIRDTSFGPTVMVGAGGTIAEAIRDTAVRLAPLSRSDAHAMIDELRAAPLLDGWRGSEKLDRVAVADTVVRLADFIAQHSEIREIEINPLRVYARGVVALDALIV